MITDTPNNGVRWRNIAALALCLFAATAMVGDVAGSRVVKGVGVVSTVAPFPKVFCEFEGMEGFASEFTLVYQSGGETRELTITPELYSRLAGPYNRRNVYGAALAGGPKLPRDLWEPVFRHGLQPGGPLREEFGLPADAAGIKVIVRTRTQGRADIWTLEPAWNE